MDKYGVALRVRLYLSEDASWHHRPAHTALLDFLRREGASGVTVLRGIEGYGAHGRIHTVTLVDLSSPLPLIVEWVDTPDRVHRLLATICDMVDALVTVEEVYVAKHPRRALRDVATSINVQDVMTPVGQVDTVVLDTPLHDLVVLLLRKRRNAVPVLDHDRRVVGIITNRDLVHRAGLPLRLELLRALGDPEHPLVKEQLAGLRGAGHTVASIMTTPAVTTTAETSLAEAARLMLGRRLKRLPVIDQQQRLVGIISRFDVLKTASDSYRAQPGERPSPLKPGDHAPRHVGEVMNRGVPVVGPNDALPDVVDAVMSTRLHRAVVVDAERRPVGIVVDTDLMQRVTPASHPNVFSGLMHRMLPTSTGESDRWSQDKNVSAENLMRHKEEMLIVPENAEITDIIERSISEQVKLVVVVGQGGRLVGMVDRADLLASLLTSNED